MDLLPVMNLMMILIPFLLMGAAFFKIGVIPTSVAAHVPDQDTSAEDPELRRVSLSLIIKPDALELTIANPAIPPETLASYGGTWPGDAAAWNLEGLQSALQRIKTAYPLTDTMVVLPHDELGYDNLVRLLDAARERQVGENELGEPIFEDLFPGVVFSRFIPPEEVPAEGEAAEGAE